MVDVLFKSYGAAQDETVFKFASDVYADQSIEIDRMTRDAGGRQPPNEMDSSSSLLAFVLRSRHDGSARCDWLVGQRCSRVARGSRAPAAALRQARRRPRHRAPQRRRTPPAAAPAAAPSASAAAAAPPAGRPRPRRRRGTVDAERRGTPPPPPPPPPAVMPPPVAPIVSATAPTPDPRVGLKAGRWDAAQAAWNMRMLSTTPPTGQVLGATHSDLAFSGNYVIQGNYNGFEIYDISNPAKPVLMQTYLCPASQNDVSVYRNLLFMSSEATNSRADCGFDGVPEPVSKLRVRGIRVFDIARRQASEAGDDGADVPRIAHAHGRHAAGRRRQRVHLRVGYRQRAVGRRSAGMRGRRDRRSEHRALPPRSDQGAAARARARGDRQLAAHLPGSAGAAAQRRARGARDERDRQAARSGGRGEGRGGERPPAAGRGRGNAGPPTGPNQCHDITVYPEIGLAGGRVRRPRSAARHPRSGASGPPRRGGRRQHVVLALGDVQQRRHEDPLHRRMGRRRPAALPRDRQEGVGRRRAVHHREQEADVPRLLQAAGAADARWRTASRTTDR